MTLIASSVLFKKNLLCSKITNKNIYPNNWKEKIVCRFLILECFDSNFDFEKLLRIFYILSSFSNCEKF